MIYLSLDTHTIKLFSLAKTFLGQYHGAYFQKTHKTDLLEKGLVASSDLVASAIKEAIISVSAEKVKEKDVCLILPQEAFHFIRYDVPQDISEAAIASFIKDKARADLPFALEESFFEFVIVKGAKESKVLVFAQERGNFDRFAEAIQLLGLTVRYVIPDTMCFFTLFEKTLRREKKELILYMVDHEEEAFGYLYDSLGLLEKDRYVVAKPIEAHIKSKVHAIEKKYGKLNRLILSGGSSEKIRQDLFTKEVGVWTNPLKKIITNFYQEYIKLIIPVGSQSFPLLDYDVCLGAFILTRENTLFSVSGKSRREKKTVTKGTKKPFIAIRFRDIMVFIISFGLSFAIIYFFPSLKKLQILPTKQKEVVTLTPTQAPPTPTPTPAFSRRDLNIKVLNGSGVAGRASTVKDTLKEKKWGEILTGNADTFDFEKTEVQVTEDKKAAISFLKEDLADFVALEKTSTLAADSTADVVIIIGKDFK